MSLITTITDSQNCCSTSGGKKLLDCYPPCEHNHDTLYYRKQQIDSRFASIELGDGSQTYFGAIAPSSALGENNDIYINTSSNTFYKKTAGNWVVEYIITTTAPTPNLQQVTNVGNTTTNSISVGGITTPTANIGSVNMYTAQSRISFSNDIQNYSHLNMNANIVRRAGNIAVLSAGTAGAPTYAGLSTVDLTSDQVYKFPNKSGTFALLSDISGGGSYTFQNGLRNDSGVVKLGLDLTTIGTTNEGALTEDTYLIKGDLAGLYLGLIIADAGGSPVLGFANSEGAGNLTSINIFSTELIIGKEVSGIAQSIRFHDDGSLLFIDDVNNKGFQYESDYSSNWTDHSLVTKKWVTDNFSGGGGSYTFQNGIREENGVVKLGASLDLSDGVLVEDLLLYNPTTKSGMGINASTSGVSLIAGDNLSDGSAIIIADSHLNLSSYSSVDSYIQINAAADLHTINIGLFDDNSYQGIIFGRTNDFIIELIDEVNNKGLIYRDDYSVNGMLDPLWVPHWSAVTDYVDSHIIPTEFEYVSSSGGILNI